MIERGRARAAKSGEVAKNQDHDEVVLSTVAGGAEALCAFGAKEAAEKAFDLSQKLGEWLKPLISESNQEVSVHEHVNGDVSGLSGTKALLSPATVESVYRAIGIAKAHWAHWTPLSESRRSLQTEALSSLWNAI